MQPNNPFLVTGYYSDKYFCDRQVETQKILDALYNGRNISLISPRRMGKTGLIKNVFYQLNKKDSDIICVYIDIYSTRSLNEFIQLFANSILGKLESTAQNLITNISKFIKSCRPNFSFDEVTGTPSVTLDIVNNNEEITLKEIFNYIESSSKRLYIAIDEFQQIAEYDNKGIEALLRSYIQFIPNVNFIFSGSKQHIMQEMFLSAKRPFYQSTQVISIDVIDKDIYYKFANEFFQQSNRSLPKDSFDNFYEQFQGHTWYIQSILNRLYASKSEEITDTLINAIINEIIEESVYTYQVILANYSKNSIALLKAVAKEIKVTEINSSSFISKYKLKAASSVNASLTKLINDELIYKTEAGYIIYDRFMAIWLKELKF